MLIVGFLTNVILNIPFLYGFDKIGLPAYYGSTTATILGYLVCAMMCLSFLKKKYHVNYDETIKRVVGIISAVLVMAIVLLVLRWLFPFSSESRMISIITVLIYSFVGASIYLLITIKNGLMKDIYGVNVIQVAWNKIRRK